MVIPIEAIKTDGRALEFASKSLRRDPELKGLSLEIFRPG